MNTNPDCITHTQGKSVFLDDITKPSELAYISIFTSPVAHAKILSLDISKAKNAPNIFGVLTASDIPGVNQIGGIIQDEVLLAEDSLHFIGQPIAIVVGKTKEDAKNALKLIELKYKELRPIVDPREAYKKNLLIHPPRTFSIGDTSKGFENCDLIIEDTVETGAQEHFYLETQSCMVHKPQEDNQIKIISSTQSPSAVHKHVANVLGLPMHKIEIDVKRLGGGFGGKEDQATVWACLSALASYKLKRSTILILNRKEDIVYTGKRHPYSSDFKLGIDKDATIKAYEVTFYQNSGAAADLSTVILERALFHTTNTYFIPNVKAIGIPSYTNLHPFTAFRGFGGPQAMFVLESAIQKASKLLNIPAKQIQEKNLLKENDQFPYGQKVKDSNARNCWKQANQEFKFDALYKNVSKFNEKNKLHKKGIAIMPICFGISFTSTFLNQAGCLVNIYNDGSVSVSTGAIEMGQGVNLKIAEIASRTLGIKIERIKLETTNTTRIPNSSPTAASSGSDLNGMACKYACEEILNRITNFLREKYKTNKTTKIEINDEDIFIDNKKIDISWGQLAWELYFNRIHLSSKAFYSTPDIYFDKSIEKGNPFAYHVFGTSVHEITLDCIRGTYKIDRIQVVHDNGKSLNELIDKGQMEGGIIQGVGWVTLENLVYNQKGQLLNNNASKYKLPDIKFIPETFEVNFLKNSENKNAVLKSKATGEPPFMYGIGTFFAIQNAMQAFRPEKELIFHAPMTPEKVLLWLYE